MEAHFTRTPSFLRVLLTAFLVPFLLAMLAGFANGRTEDWLGRAAVAVAAMAVLSILAQVAWNLPRKRIFRFKWSRALNLAYIHGMAAFLGFSAGVIWFH